MKILSGIQPSGNLHLGNYLAAIKQHVQLQSQAEQAIYLIVDLHAITVPQDPARLKNQILSTAAFYLACGLDPKKSILFVQSQVSAHAELSWILSTITYLGELERMTQFKDKGRGKKRTEVGVGLFTYPVLMAADILLYQADTVPVGHDQVQHIELARDLAKRFNHRFGDTFTLPQPLIEKRVSRIMGLDDPTKKMSKSADSIYNYIALNDNPNLIRQKISRAVTDSGSEISYRDDKPAIRNLLTIYSGVTGQTIEQLEQNYQQKNYATFKNDLAEAIIEFLKPIQDRYQQIMKDQTSLIEILTSGAKKALPLAQKTLTDVKTKVGLII